MRIAIDIPEEAEPLLRQAWGSDIDRAALEALVIEGYRSGKLSASEVGRCLGISNRWAVNQWLADRSVYINYTEDDLEADRRTLDEFFGKSA